ncbi:MYOSIN-BINDING PROTEIN 1 [Salix purpurea]|uniref:MYOSIN-BINDING PROTEIN 1 n=1 Tax=Salix purpurea TaxID=77065 RepID=A0A9Q0W964_SALPP|nr:MYOSIN-BINDING PROTEIN 1 [Salix purpurea]
MAASGVSSVQSKKKSWSISTALASAVLEWLLIPHVCYAQRLDHILGSRKLRYCWDLICGNHKLEVSSLVFCHAHNNLVDVHGMCENCLFSFATINKSNAETYRLLVGKLGEDSSSGLDQDPLLDDHSSVTRLCSCCNEPWIPRGYCQKLIRAASVGSGAAKIKKTKRSTPIRSTRRRTSGFDPLSHVGYTELKFISDTESEVMFFSDDGGANAATQKDISAGYVQPEPRTIILVNDSASEKLIDPVSAPEPSILTSKVQFDAIQSHTVTATESEVPIRHDLEELNWQQADCKANPFALPEFISHEVPRSSYVKETPLEASNESKIVSANNVHPSSKWRESPVKISDERKLISLADFLPSSKGAQTSVLGLKERCIAREVEDWQMDCEDLCKAESQPAKRIDTASEINPISGENGQQFANLLDLSDAYKVAVGNRRRQLSGVLAEQWTGEGFFKIKRRDEALDQSMNAMSPRVPISPRVLVSPKLSLNCDELRTSDASNVVGMQILQKRITLERNESSLSLDGSIVSEIEGESTDDRLKRQVEHDKKLLSALYKELEEERNASTISANQAMAMITRLQEEKAALHMEALQYLRMMEEQSEYDMEALQKKNDLLTEKEKEVQDLEEDLEFYRIPLLEFEDERSYITQSLKKLKRKLFLLSNKGLSLDLIDGKHSEGEKGNNLRELNSKVGVKQNIGAEENELSMTDRRSDPVEEGHVSLLEKSFSGSKENSEVFYSGESSPMPPLEIDLDSLVNEVSDLSERLEALEADRNFLEHIFNSIRYGEEGLHFIKEIAFHLKELRKIRIPKMEQEQITA